MAQETTKKRSASSRASSPRGGAATKAKKEAAAKARRQRYTLLSIGFFALSALLLVLVLFEGQPVWNSMRDVLFGLFGVCAYALWLIVMFLSLMCAYEKRLAPVSAWSACVLALAVCGAVFIFGRVEVMGGEFPEQIANLYLSGVELVGGGVFSAVFGWSLVALCGHPAADIIIVVIILVLIMILTGKSLGDLVELIRNGGESRRKRLAEERELLGEPETLTAADLAAAAPRRAFDFCTATAKKLPEAASPADQPKPQPEKARRGKGKGVDVSLEGVGPASAIDIELGPDPLPPEEAVLPEGAALPGPAAAVVGEVFEQAEQAERERMEQDRLFARFSGKSEPEAPSKTVEPEPVEEPARAEEHPKELTQPSEYKFPPLSLLSRPDGRSEGDVTAELRANAEFLVKTLESFNVRTRVVDIARGPTVTRYELQPLEGVRINRITNLANDIALNLAAANVRIEAPIPNKAAVGIEVPNKKKLMVHLRTVLESERFKKAKSPLTVALGRDISGNIMTADIASMPHLLIAGTTGSGKSICLHCMIISMIYKSSPKDLRFVFIDPKMVEFGRYNGIPHMEVPVVTDPRKASGALGWAVGQMLKRYQTFAQCGVRDIDGFNRLVEREKQQPDLGEEEGEPLEPMPRIVLVIDELADLMMAAPREVEDSICRLAQMARAAGIHLIIATQRPSVDVITGVIKANIASRIALSVSSQVDSRTIIDQGGAEKLLGKGDMLFQPMELPKPVRIQGCYVSDEEIDAVVGNLKKNAVVEYNEQIMAEMERLAAKDKGDAGSAGTGSDESDDMFDAAVGVVVELGEASTSMLQRRLKLGYARAARIVDMMEERGIVGPKDGSKPRTVNLTMSQWQEIQMRRDAEGQ